MARYIDVDKLIDYITKNVVCTSKDSEECKEFMIVAMEFFTPTADVVPRAELDRLERLNADYAEIIRKQDDEISQLRKELLSKQNLEESFSKSVKVIEKRCLKTVEKAKTEVAREIFAEIEKFTYRYLNDADYSGGDMIYDIAELKEKYT